MSGESGQVDMVVAMFFFLLVLLGALFQFKVVSYMAAGAYVEDALAASDLASALIDVEEYGRTHEVRISDPADAFEIYRDALQYNLALDEAGCSAKTELLAGKVQIRQYIVYNVRETEVQITGYDGQGNCILQEKGIAGTVRTPDGTPVEHTTIYSRVSFQVMGILDSVIETEKEKSVDIARYESEE